MNEIYNFWFDNFIFLQILSVICFDFFENEHIVFGFRKLEQWGKRKIRENVIGEIYFYFKQCALLIKIETKKLSHALQI